MHAFSRRYPHGKDSRYRASGVRVEAVAAQMAIVIVHIAAVGVGELELCACDQSACHTVFLLNYQSASLFVPERQLLHRAAFDEDVLRSTIEMNIR